MKIRCPQCQNSNSKVIDSRGHADGKTIRRRRVCKSCDCRFSTSEKIVQEPKSPEWFIENLVGLA